MRRVSSLWPPFALVALGLAVFAGAFLRASSIFGRAVSEWAARELEARVALAADNLKGPLAVGDFRAMRAFGDACGAAGEQLIVLSGPGGLVYDSLGTGEDDSRFAYRARACGDYTVMMGLPLARVRAPIRRANRLFAWSSVTGAAAMLLVFHFVYRQRVRIRELKKVEQFRRDFVADVSHELKTPLTGILGAVDLLGDAEALPPDARRRLLGMVKKESLRLNDLAQNILSLSRIGRARDATFAETDLSEIVRETVERFSAKAAAAPMRLRARLPRADSGAVAPCPAVCDAQLVAQALANLVENAIRYSGAPEAVVSAGRAEGGLVTLAVEDRGAGVPPEHRARIFERFYRADPARAAETGGSGLGLAIVREIARLHGGDAAYFPVEPSGSRFEIVFPARGPRRRASRPQ